MSSASPDPQAKVRLTVADRVPTAELAVFDSSYGRVAGGIGELSKDLPVGVYEVELLVGDDRQRQFAILNPGRTENIFFDRPQLEFASAAPLESTSTSREWHMGPAAEWSRKKTMAALPGAQCRLFVFVRTLEPQRYTQTYDRHLRLLDRRGKVLCDFNSGVQRQPDQGWTALNVDLPAGFYQLYRGGRGRPARYQPLWLSPDWETQVFIPGGAEPRLGELALFMAQMGYGFWPNDPAALAVETVLAGLRGGRNLTDSDQMRILLKDKFDNPWLGVLALHAMRLQPSTNSNLASIVHGNTRARLGEHPDLRALELKEGQPAAQPFDVPPMLWASLKLVRDHAAHNATTLKPTSLASRIFDSLVIDSDWVAWHTLPRRRKPAPIQSVDQAMFTSSGSKWVLPSFDVPGELAGGATLGDLFENPDTPESNPLLADLIWLTDTVPFDQDPGPIPYAANPSSLLEIDDAARISRQLNLPLEKVQRTLERMRNSPELLAQPRLMTITELSVADEVLRRRSASGQPLASRGAEAALVSLSASASALVQARGALARLRKGLRQRADWVDALNQRLDGFAGWLRSRQDALLLVDANTQVVYANPAFEALEGRPLEEMAVERLDVPGSALLSTLNGLPGSPAEISVSTPSGSRDYKVQRLRIQDEVSSESVAAIYRLRPADQQPLSPEQLNDIRHRLYNVVLYASLALYASPGDQDKYLTYLDRDIAMLSQFVH